MLEGLLARARAFTSPPAGKVAVRAAEPLSSRLGASPFVSREPERWQGLGPRRAAPVVAGGHASVGPEAPPPLPNWGEDPTTGEPLPVGPRLVLDPGAFREARIAHRHAWFPALAFAAAQGDTAAGEAAVGAMDGWLRQDIPGTGVAWAHPSDLAARLLHWHAGLAWLGAAAPDTLRAAMAGSAQWHIEHLRERLPRAPGDHARRIAHHCGVIVGALTFPDLPGSRAAWTESVSALRFALPEELHPDGSPQDDAPLRLAETLWYVAVARAVARANGASFPTVADAALVRGARFLERLAGELGALPPLGEAPLGDLLDVPGRPLAWGLWNLVRAWGLDDGPPAPHADDDPRVAWLAPGVPHPAGPLAEPLSHEAAGKTWSMWVFRESGLAVAHMRIKNRPSRVVAAMGTPLRSTHDTHVAPLHLLWDVGDASVLADPGPSQGAGRLASWLRSPGAHNVLLLDGHAVAEGVPASLGVARVDGKKARIEGSHTGWHRLRVPLTHERDVLLNQARLIVTDRLVPAGRRVGRHAVRLSWQLGPGWSLTPEGTGYLAKRGDLTLVIQLPAALAWSVHSGESTPGPVGWVRTASGGVVAAPCLVGDGGVDGGAEFVTSFEVR
ncbi:MAG: heparinase II/III family protein [Pseudomonadota bacterium]|nr:heparinase II/III family protein [Pseudomonadota bacterium]